MGWKTVVGTGSVLMAAVGGCWWAVVASASPPAPAIGPAVVVTPATGTPSPASAVRSRSPATATPDRDLESPEVVDPQWVRPVDGDEEEDKAAEVGGD